MSFYEELRRRNVVRVGVAYVVIAWLLAQVAEFAFENFGAPEWVLKSFVVVLLLGMPLVLIFAWAFELTPDGVKLEKDVDRSQPITPDKGRKLNRVTIVVMALAIAYFAFDKFVLSGARDSSPAPTTAEAATEVQKSIAVLPFVDMSQAKDQEYFTDGLTENLLNALARMRELRVAGRTSSFAFKNRNEDLRGIGEQLGVAHILEGSVQKSGEQVRITAQLINSNDGYHLWSETYDRTLDNIFDVQDEIASEVAKAMQVALLGQGSGGQALLAHDATEAYNEYLKGHHEAGRSNLASYRQALVHYERALELDPKLALAWAGHAASLANITGFVDTDFSAGYEEARASALRALELDPDLPEAHMALAEIQSAFDWDWAAAEASLQRAQSLRPGDANIRLKLALLKWTLGQVDDAVADIQRVVEQDPLNFWALLYLAHGFARDGQHEEAMRIFDRIEKADLSRTALYWNRGYTWLKRGDYEKAREEFAREPLAFLRLTGEAIAWHHEQQRDKAVTALQELISTMGESSAFQIASVYAQWGDADNAMSWLQRAYVIRDPGLQYLTVIDLFGPIEDDPRFQAFVRKMGLRE